MKGMKLNLKILFHCPSKRVGGSQILLTTLARQLLARGHTVVFTSSSDTFRTDPVPYHRVETLDDMSSLMASFQPDFLLFSNSPLPVAAQEMSESCAQTIEIVQSNRQLESEALIYPHEFTDHHVFVSDSARRFFYAPLPDSVSTVIPNGLDLARFPRCDRSGRDRLTVLTVGSVQAAGKNALDILDVASGLPPSRFRFVHVGGGPASAGAFNRSARLPEGVDFTHIPWSERIEDHYREADLFLSFSRHEGFGLAIAEAAASGLPLVLRRCYGITECIEDGKQALYCDEIQDFISRIETLAEDRPLRERLGAAARMRIEAGFDLASMVDAYENLLIELKLKSREASGTPTME